MAHQVRSFEVSVPPGSTRAVPQVTDMSFGSFEVASIEVEIPPGPLGQVGFQIASSRQQVIPWNAGQWIVANDATKRWVADNYPNSGDWQLVAYNTGAFTHTLWVRFELDPVVNPDTAALTVTAIALSNVAPAESVNA